LRHPTHFILTADPIHINIKYSAPSIVASGHIRPIPVMTMEKMVSARGRGLGGRSLLVLMIEAPHPPYTHSRSSLYIYNAIQHLLQ
jgi:hypothetical protein